MKREDILLGIAGATVAAVSVFGLLSIGHFSDGFKLPTGTHFQSIGLSSTSVVVAFLVGAFSAYLTDAVRRLSWTRRVFISYSSESAQVARSAADALRKAGVKVWDPDQLRPGVEWEPQVRAAMSDADALVLFLPSKPNRSVEREVELARAKGIRIFPVLSESIEPTDVPRDISGLARIDLRGDTDRELHKLVDAVTSASTSSAKRRRTSSQA